MAYVISTSGSNGTPKIVVVPRTSKLILINITTLIVCVPCVMVNPTLIFRLRERNAILPIVISEACNL